MVSKSAIFTLHPACVNSTARSRAIPDLPTPPFWERREMIGFGVIVFKAMILGIANCRFLDY